MNVDESRAKQWLQQKGYTSIRFVTNTNDQPPDFIVNDDIAVEVRRLNLMVGDENKGLESVEKPLARSIRTGLATAEPPPQGYRAFVDCDFLYTELPDKNMVVDEVRKAANQYTSRLNASIHHDQPLSRFRVETDFGLIVRFNTGTNPTINQFDFMSVVAGVGETGDVLGDAIDSLNRSISEKSDKIKKKHCLYAEWWLILADYNVYATVLRDPYEAQATKNALTDTSLWSRIIILSNLEGVPDLNLLGVGSTWGSLLLEEGLVTERGEAFLIGSQLDMLVPTNIPTVEQAKILLAQFANT